MYNHSDYKNKQRRGQYEKTISLLLVVLVAFVLVGCESKVTITIHDADKELTIEEGSKDTVTPVVEGEAVLVWETSNAQVATVEGGKVTAVKDGNYYIPTTHVGSSYGQVVCIRGGNLNGIGIESAVNSGSDVYLTWQYSAKFIAQLLIKHNMTPERVLFHNNFSNKPCPRTMMTADLVETFLDLVYMEYEIAKNYSDYTITFTSHNPEILDNTGRIVSYPKLTTNVSYTITVTKGNETQSVTLNSLIIGQYN